MENPSANQAVSVQPTCPSDLVAKRIYPDERASVPRELLRLKRTRANAAGAAEVWIALDDFCSRQRPGTWQSAQTLATELGVSKRTVEFALQALETSGYIARDWHLIAGHKHRVIWCLWLIPDNFAGCAFDLGMGVKVAAEQLEPTPLQKSTDHLKALFSAPMSAKNASLSAADPAPKIAQDLEHRQSTLILAPTSTKVDPTQEESIQPAPADESPAVVPPPVEPAPILDPEFCRRMLARPSTGPLMAARFVWALIDQDLEQHVPLRFQGENRPPRPAPEVPLPPIPVEPPSRPKLPPIVGAIENLETQTLVNRLPHETPDRQKEIIELVADRQAMAWNEWDSLGAFRNKLRLLASKQITLEKFWKAFQGASRATPGYQGATFNRILRPEMNRIKAQQSQPE